MKSKRLFHLFIIASSIILLIGLPFILYFLFTKMEPTEPELKADLWSAFHSQDTNRIKVLIERNPQLIKARYDGSSLLHLAASDGDVELVKYLLGLGMDPNIREVQHQWTPLHLCTVGCIPMDPESVKQRYLETTKLLLKSGADINAKSGSGTSTLIGSLSSDLRMVQLLVESGADTTDTSTQNDGSVLNLYEVALKRENMPVAEYLKPLMKPKIDPPSVPVPSEENSNSPGPK